MRNASLSVIQALVAVGHVLPKPINLFAFEPLVHLRLSMVRWLLQQGVTLDAEVLTAAAVVGRVGILQLAHTLGAPIAAEVIDAAITNANWHVLVWACRNGIAFDNARARQQVRKAGTFTYSTQRDELLSLLKHEPRMLLQDNVDHVKHTQKLRKLKR